MQKAQHAIPCLHLLPVLLLVGGSLYSRAESLVYARCGVPNRSPKQFRPEPNGLIWSPTVRCTKICLFGYIGVLKAQGTSLERVGGAGLNSVISGARKLRA